MQVSGEYLLTLHEERVALTEQVALKVAEGRSEQYVVYSVLDAMVAHRPRNELAGSRRFRRSGKGKNTGALGRGDASILGSHLTPAT